MQRLSLKNKSLSFGIRRYALINSGDYRYGIFPMDAALSVCGNNNMGKSQAINSLQFLLFKSTNEMNFGKYDAAKSREFYFKTDSSYIVAELITNEGVFLFGAYGKGPGYGYEYQLFVAKTGFQDEFFIDNGRVLTYEESMARLEQTTRVHKINRDEARQVLSGEYIKTPVKHDLSLVPLRNAGEKRYSIFKRIYKNLITLNDMRERDIKRLILDVFSDTLTDTKKFNYREEVSLAFREHDLLKEEIATLKGLEKNLERYQNRLSFYRHTRDDLEETRATIAQTAMAFRERADGEAELIRNEIQTAKNNLELVESRNKERGLARDELMMALRHLKDEQDEYEKADREFALTSEEAITGEIEDYQRRLAELNEAMKGASHSTPDQIRTDLRRLEQQKEQRSKALTALTSSQRIMDKIGLAPEVLEEASRVINPEILSLDIDTVEGDANLLKRWIEERQEELSDGRLSAEGFSVPLAGISGINLGETEEDLRREINRIDLSLMKLKKELDAAEDKAKSQREIKRLNDEIYSANKDLINFHRYCDLKKDLDKRTTNIAEASAKLDEVTSVMNGLVEEVRQLQSRYAQAQQRMIKHNEDQQAIKRFMGHEIMTTKSLRDLEGSYVDMDLDIAAAVDHAAQDYAIFCNVLNELTTADREILQVYSKHASLETLEERIEQVIADHSALPEKQEMQVRLNQIAITKISSRLKDIYDNWLRLESAMSELNHSINKKKVSNLQQFKIELRPYQKQIDAIYHLIESSASNDDQMTGDLLRSAAWEENMNVVVANDANRTLGAFVDDKGGDLLLEDLFELSFVLVDVNGKKNEASDLDEMASNGSTMTIKVLINIYLIRHLMDAKMFESRYLPFYVDEAGAIDSTNQESLINVCRELGFIPVFASVQASEVTRYIIDIQHARTGNGIMFTTQDWITNDPLEDEDEQQDFFVEGEES
jgi:hypothetical protein